MDQLKKLISKDEKIVWEGKPNKTAMVLRSIPSSFIGMVILGFIAPFGIVPLATGILTEPFSGNGISGLASILFTAPFVCFSLPFLLIGLYVTLSPLWAFFAYKNIYYIFTDKQVLISGGIFPNIKVFPLTRIGNMEVAVGLFDKTTNTGTIQMYIGEIASSSKSTYTKTTDFASIDNPYEVFGKLKEYVK